MTYKNIAFSEITRFSKISSLIGIVFLLLFFFASSYALPVYIAITILALAYVIAQFNLSHFYMIMVFVIPFAVNQKIFLSDVTLLLPSQPIEAVITLAFFIKLLFGYKISASMLKHPIFLLSMLCLLMQFVSTIRSDIPLVSLKTIFLKSCYFIVFFVVSADLYLKQQISHIKLLKVYTFSILIVGILIFIKHFDYGLSKDISGTVTEPFYADHTIYSACLAFIIPLPILAYYNSKVLGINFNQKFWIGCLALALLTFFFFTYCRAGWISLLIAVVITFAINAGLSFKGLAVTIFTAIILLFVYQAEIIDGIKQNKSDSNAKNATLKQQTKSVTNITNDQSNAERLNRWSCAWRMFLDKPFFGYGPGTYQFEYLSYQKKSEMTRISVTSPYNIKKGKGGTAHSEYLLLLSETGILSLFFYLGSILVTIYYALKVYKKAHDPVTSIQILIVFFGLCTYHLHAFFNNFLDTDKAALLYYTSIAYIMVAAIQLKQKPNQTTI